jgi:hypothetical protein
LAGYPALYGSQSGIDEDMHWQGALFESQPVISFLFEN